MIRVGIVDDHKLVAYGLEKLIDGIGESGGSSSIAVVGTAHSAAECRKLLAAGGIDVLLLDISLPDGNGIELCPRIKSKYPAVKVLMLTSYGELSVVESALDAGADGYVLKNSLPQEIIDGIRTVAAGRRFICGDVEAMLKTREDNPFELTRREYNLLRLIAEGCTNAEIADRLNLGYETIKSYRKNLYSKLGSHTTAELVQNAKALKLV